jgi:MFS superfamily sulfate permease-like transporter
VFLSLFFFLFATTKQQTAEKERKGRIDRSIDQSKEAKGTFSLPLSSSFHFFLRDRTRERVTNDIYQIDDVYLFFCFSRHHDRDKNDRDEKRRSEGEEEEEMVSAQSEFVR